MPSVEHKKRSSKIHAVFQDTTETWLDRPRRSDCNDIPGYTFPGRPGSQPAQTPPLVLPNQPLSTSRNGWDGQETTDSSPSVRAGSGVTPAPRSRRRKKAAPAPEGLDQRLVTTHHPISALAEQYRKLYIEIVRAGRVRELRTLLVSSALPGEGKTSSAVNLALTMAASGGPQNVLLVDADFRKPSVHKLLGTSPEYGLVDYLLGDFPYTQLFAPTQVPGLTVVYAGRQVENPTALLSSEKMGQFFKDVKDQEQYSYIILDTSPVLVTSEPAALAQYVDASILVVRAGSTPRDMVTQAVGLLGHENILGCVLNGVTSSAYQYYHSYYAGYYQAQ